MKVVLINHSDTLGGASVVTYRLMEALRAAGVDARMVVGKKTSSSADVSQATPQWRRKAAFLAECGWIYTHNGFSRADLFKVSVADFGMPLWKHPWVQQADVVVLNWINQGLLSWRGIERIAAEHPVVWTMHDMWNLTGGCHHAGECNRYRATCGLCPFLGARRENDLTHRAHQRKERMYATTNIHFVAVSTWLAQRCRESSLMADAQVTVIPNAFPIEHFDLQKRSEQQRQRPVVVMGAARLDDPIKDFPTAIAALNLLADRGIDAEARFFGAIRDESLLQSLRLPYTWHGMVADPQPLYYQSDVVLSTSLYETLPGTIIEGMAAGCVPVATDSGGQRDIIDTQTGFLCPRGDANALSDALIRALRNAAEPDIADRLNRRINDLFADSAIAHRYIDLFNTLTHTRP